MKKSIFHPRRCQRNFHYFIFNNKRSSLAAFLCSHSHGCGSTFAMEST